jgi:hypothetical protein
MGQVLHILMNKSGLNIYPSVYNALYCWQKLGLSNHIITAGSTEGFGRLISSEYRFSGGYVRRASQLASIRGHFDAIIVYDPQDVAMLYAASWLYPKYSYNHVVHHCLEIPTGVGPLIRYILRRGYGITDRLILQDSGRADLFFQTFPQRKKLDHSLVTNSYITSIEPMADSVEWFDNVRAKSEWLVLYAGAIDRWAVSIKMLDVLATIPNVTFAFSGWSKDDYAKQLAERYRHATNVHFSLGMKSRANLNYMVANADIGLVCYESINDPNIRHVGLASGKMHKFLSFDKPLLVNAIPSLHDFVAKNGFGVCVSIDEFPLGVRQLMQTYANLQCNIRQRYSRLCDYEKEYTKFLSTLLGAHHLPPQTIRADERQPQALIVS